MLFHITQTHRRRTVRSGKGGSRSLFDYGPRT